MRDLLVKLLDYVDPPAQESIIAPCPDCGRDVWRRNVEFRIDPDVTFVRCLCGAASAWVLDDDLPRLVLTMEPEELED